MYRIALLLCFLLEFALAFGQSQKFGLKSSVWYYTNGGGTAPPNTYLWKISYERDTLIHGYAGQVFGLEPKKPSQYGLKPEYIFRYAQDTVYTITPWGEWGLLYCFNAEAGDTLEVPDYLGSTKKFYTFVIDSVDTLQTATIGLKVFYLSNRTGSMWYSGNSYFEYLGNNFFLPVLGVVPEDAGLRCYEDQFRSVHFDTQVYPCDYGNPEGVEDADVVRNVWSVFPNPNHGRFLIRGEVPEWCRLNVFDVHGKSVYQTESSWTQEFDVQLKKDYSKGLYLVVISGSGQTRSVKVLVE